MIQKQDQKTQKQDQKTQKQDQKTQKQDQFSLECFRCLRIHGDPQEHPFNKAYLFWAGINTASSLEAEDGGAATSALAACPLPRHVECVARPRPPAPLLPSASKAGTLLIPSPKQQHDVKGSSLHPVSSAQKPSAAQSLLCWEDAILPNSYPINIFLSLV